MSITSSPGTWIDAEIQHGWASCAITQNGFVRIISQPRYPSPVSPSQAMDLLARAAGIAHHEFWPCTISVLDSKLIDRRRVHGPKQVTDAYLLALATAHNGRFVTFDQAVAPAPSARRRRTTSRCSNKPVPMPVTRCTRPTAHLRA
jgi:toxin-antitoxin system PIN domain toxin